MRMVKILNESKTGGDVMSNKVFLGGTCNNTTWRTELIMGLKCNYFNPVVDDWTPECQKVEMDEKTNKCDIHLYVITSAMTGTFSIAEATDSSHRQDKLTIFQVIPDGFDEHQLKSLRAIVDLIKGNGNIAYFSKNMDKTTQLINIITKD